MVNVAAACTAAAAQRAERVDVSFALELHLTAENALVVRADGPDVQACAAAAVAGASAGSNGGEGELAVGVGEQSAGAALTAVGAGSIRTAGALLLLTHRVALVAVVAREAVRIEPGLGHRQELQLVVLVEDADQCLTEGTRDAGATSGTAGDHEAHVEGLVVLVEGHEFLVGACHEHAALTGVVGAQVAACAAACGGGCVAAVQCHAQCRVQLILGLGVEEALVGGEGSQLCAAATCTRNGYDGDCAVADELDRGGAAAGRTVHVAAVSTHYLRCAGCGAGAGGVAARCVAFAAECGLRAGRRADAAVTRPDAQDIAGLDRQNAAELRAGTAAS